MKKKIYIALWRDVMQESFISRKFNLSKGVFADPDLTVQFGVKDRLKKNTITIFNYKTWFVGYLENDLSLEEKKEVDSFLTNNTSFKTEFELLKQSKFIPDHRIIFENKKSIRKGNKIIVKTVSEDYINILL